MHSQPLALIADDNPQLARLVARVAREEGFAVVVCANGHEALERLDRRPDVAVVDFAMGDVSGLDVLRHIRSAVPDCEVVLMSGVASVDVAVEAIKSGARDYLPKPFEIERLRTLLQSARREAERRRQVLAGESRLARQLTFCGMIGRTPVMQDLFNLLRRLAPHVRTALILGETGAGKELVAHALHEIGPRRTRRFIPVNCSAIVETLFESELFGHVRGAFTGAAQAKAGLFELADGGTLFLDEIGELPLALQAKLLRVLEQGEVQPVGATASRRVDVCVLAATNRDLLAEVEAQRFRSDLFYRLNVVEIRVPPLRDRRGDIPYLTAAFVANHARQLGKDLALSPGAERLLEGQSWPGNVRELKHVVERACLMAEHPTIAEADLQAALGRSALATPAPESLQDAEREHIRRILQDAGGNKAAAARKLGVSRRSLYRHLERLDLTDLLRRSDQASSPSDRRPRRTR
ncbi:MAG: sigma-54-dependent Fis family transcriptional regulator [Acidobacteriota bacterium]|nr:sigma-54-dependent Fis family transcriptional regulator [Acidobacteriota bacterium]